MIRYNYKLRRSSKKGSFFSLEVMTGDANSAAPFARAEVPVWVGPKYADASEMLIIDEKIVLKNFSSPSKVEVIEDPAVASLHCSELKSGRDMHRNEHKTGLGCLGDLLQFFLPIFY